MTALFLTFGVAAIFSWLALTNRFVLLNFVAGVAWVALFMVMKTSPPAGITEGSSTHTVMLLFCVVAAVAIPLVGLGRNIRTQRTYDSGLQIEEGRWKLNKPKFLEDPVKKAKLESEMRQDEYRAKIRRKLRRRR